MKFATVRKSLVLALALLFAASAFAGTKATLQLSDPVTVNGNRLKPGEYKLQWEGNGPNVELSIIQGKNVIKVPAHVIELQTPAANDAALIQGDGSEAGVLSGIRFQGKKFALDLSQSGDALQAGGSSK